MLQGTLDVFSLDEVLGLLSGANKSGVLNITGDRGVGTVSIADGQLVDGSVSSAPEASELSDVLFELFRYEEGSFSFDGAAGVEGEPHELADVLTKAHARFDEWKGIEAVVPSLDHQLALAQTLSTTQVTLSESEWATVVAIGEGASVGVVAQRLSLGEFDGSKRVKSLIERSLATIGEPSHASSAPVIEMPELLTPEPAPASFADAAPSLDTAPALDALPVVDDEPAFVAPVPAEPAVEPIIESPVDTAELATEFSFEVAAEAPAFDDTAELATEEIPPMPDAPAFGASDDAGIPPMPEPPSGFGELEGDSVPPPPAPPAPEPEAAAPFGGLDPIQSSDMFEPPRRSDDRRSDAFGGAGFDQPSDHDDIAGSFSVETDMEAPMPPPPGGDVPSFDPPAGFDAASFDAPPFDADVLGAPADDAVAESEGAEGADMDDSNDKGGSLLMRYLKSNG